MSDFTAENLFLPGCKNDVESMSINVKKIYIFSSQDNPKAKGISNSVRCLHFTCMPTDEFTYVGAAHRKLCFSYTTALQPCSSQISSSIFRMAKTKERERERDAWANSAAFKLRDLNKADLQCSVFKMYQASTWSGILQPGNKRKYLERYHLLF